MSEMIRVNEVAEICNIGHGKAYKIIQEINKEMKSKGYIVIQGRVNKLYLLERLGIVKGE